MTCYAPNCRCECPCNDTEPVCEKCGCTEDECECVCRDCNGTGVHEWFEDHFDGHHWNTYHTELCDCEAGERLKP